MIRFRAWGERARQLLEPLLDELQRLPIGQAPQAAWRGGQAAHSASYRTSTADGTPETSLNGLKIPVRSELPAKSRAEVYVSYAWGDDSSQNACQRTEVVERLITPSTGKPSLPK